MTIKKSLEAYIKLEKILEADEINEHEIIQNSNDNKEVEITQEDVRFLIDFVNGGCPCCYIERLPKIEQNSKPFNADEIISQLADAINEMGDTSSKT